ncbi:MAG: hypothetical protein P8Z76_19820 [Alphaproteobacteria bacterium]
MNASLKVVAAGLLPMIVACSPEQMDGDRSEPISLEVSIDEIMTGVITPATNVIWGRSFADDLSAEDWQRFLQSAIQISLSASALSLVPPEANAGGNLAAGDTARWREWSSQLAGLAEVAKAAALTKDQAALVDAGDAMVEICEACHTAYLAGAQ